MSKDYIIYLHFKIDSFTDSRPLSYSFRSTPLHIPSTFSYCSAIIEAYKSAYAFASQEDFGRHCVTKEEYAESGSNASRRKFRDWKAPPGPLPRETTPTMEKEEVTASKEVAKPKGRQREEDRSTAGQATVTNKLSRTRSKIGVGAAIAPGVTSQSGSTSGRTRSRRGGSDP